MSQFLKLLYIILLASLVLHPHFITGHIYTIPAAYTQSLTTIILLMLTYLVYRLSKYEFARKEHQKTVIEKRLKVTDEKLSDSWKYIGKINRRLPTLSGITSGLLSKTKRTKKSKKSILQNLLNTAVVSIARTECGMFRFVEVNKQKTVREIRYTDLLNNALEARISNKQLLEKTKDEKFVNFTGNIIAVSSSDDESLIKCFLITPATFISEENKSILRAVVDQALLFHEFMYNNPNSLLSSH